MEARGVAPHEGREEELIRAGLKQYARLEWSRQRERCHALMKSGDFDYRMDKDGVSFWKHGDQNGETRDEMYRQLISMTDEDVITLGVDNYRRTMGVLFDYSDEEIESFINSEITCDCKMCRGVSRDIQK